MTKEQAIKFANCLKNNYTIDIYAVADFCDMVINALEIVEEFEKARIITGGRLNGRTYAYKCGLEDGKRKALEQEENNGKVALIKPSQNTITLRQLMQPTSEDCVSREKAIVQLSIDLSEIELPRIKESLDKLPPVTPTRKVGKWIRKPIRNEKGGCIGAEMICSYCKKDNEQDKKLAYCPNCGAEMRGNEND